VAVSVKPLLYHSATFPGKGGRGYVEDRRLCPGPGQRSPPCVIIRKENGKGEKRNRSRMQAVLPQAEKQDMENRLPQREFVANTIMKPWHSP
jgi:hypothetical protein